MEHPNKVIMQKAIDLTKKKKSIACVIVKDGKIVAQGTNTVKKEKNPFRHAEINAIEIACKKIGSFDLSDCWLYSTYEPCPMCASACVWARLKGVVFGANMDDRNSQYTQRVLLHSKIIFDKGEPKLKLHENFMRDECKEWLFL